MLLLGVGAGPAFPPMMTLAMSTRDAGGLRAALRARQHDAAGRRRARAGDPRHARDVAHGRACSPTATSAPAALTGGYTLAFTIGAGFIVAAIAIAVVVLKPERATATEPAVEPAYSDAA